MGVSYVGINIDSFTYIALLLFALVFFVIIWIIAEIKRQKRHNRMMHHKIANN